MTPSRYICPVCHETAEWRVCFKCGGKDGRKYICSTCKNDGGYWQCPNHHNAAPEVEKVSP